MRETRIEALLRRDRAIIAGALILIIALAWLYVARLAAGMDMPSMDMTGMRMVSSGFAMVMTSAFAAWSVVDFALMLMMWWVMMIGMMLPSAAPMILVHARVGRSAAATRQPFGATAWFASGYLLVWTGFALAATGAQWALETAALLTPMMQSTNEVLGGLTLILAGLYQLSPLKSTCLAQCQSPLLFIERHGGFRRDPPGALWLGVQHGAYCLGCCWALMLLLFVGGIMNLMWIAALSALVLAEKVAPAGHIVARAAGFALVGAGAWLIGS